MTASAYARPIHFIHDDCRAAMRRLIDAGVQVHACLTDPPYHLESIVRRFGKAGAAPAKHGRDGSFARISKGFMGKRWDGGADGYRIAFDPELWRLVHDLLKPGGYVLAFGSPRTGHRMACAIEDAGFIMHPFIGWAYGQGMPKAKAAGDGWYYGTQSRKPALEPIYAAQKPFAEKTGLANIAKYGTGAVNIDGCRVPSDGGRARIGEDSQDKRYVDSGATNFAFKPGPRGGGERGRWPANLCHDGSAEVLATFPDAPRGDSGSAARFFGSFPYSAEERSLFYHAKAKKTDRAGSTHPTVKPVALLRDLVRFITPPGGTVLDPFAGSGTTGAAALAEGLNAILIEAEDEYAADIRRRFDLSAPVSDVDSLLGDSPTLGDLLG